MVRTKLLLAIVGFLAVISVSTAVLFWSVYRVHYLLERSHIAQSELAALITISDSVHTLFLDEGSAETAHTLQTAITRLQSEIEYELEFLRDADERTGELEEVDRVAALAHAVTLLLHRKNVQTLHAQTDNPFAGLSTDQLERRIRDLLHGAIADEADESQRARLDAQKILNQLTAIAIVVSAIGILLALILAVFLNRRIREPISRLMAGVRDVGAGRLGTQINIAGEDEFAKLGQALDQMSKRLQRQHSDLISAQADLEAQVHARTQELNHANAQLRETNAAREQFLADVSHELRTPITIIRGEADVTLRGREKSPSSYQEALTNIVDQAAILGRLVDDLLMIARAKAGESQLSLAPIQLPALLDAAYKNGERLARGQIVLSVEGTVPEVTISGDEDRLLQLFLILIDNAIQHCPGGSVVHLSAYTDDEFVVIEVLDDGPGMPSTEANRAFERFHRGNRARSQAPQGLGLGLPIAKSIVELHRGHISLHSETGEGTTIRVALPILEQSLKAAE